MVSVTFRFQSWIFNLCRIFMFGGVCDKDGDEEIDSDSEGEGDEESAMFYNELYSIHFDGERATWSLVKYTGS